MKATAQEFNQKKEQILDYLRFFDDVGANSFDILEGCDLWSYRFIKVKGKKIIGPISELASEGLIRYDYDTEHWYIVNRK
jgi:hypothetical protein